MTRPLAIASGALLAASIAVLGWIAAHGDVPAPDDRDLRLAASPIAGGNGFEQFEAAARAARLPKDEPTWRRFHAFRAGETWEPEWISELVAQNATATEQLQAGLAAPAFAFPPLGAARAGDDHLDTLFRIQQLVALAGARARLLLHDGHPREAFELASFGLRVGKRVSAAENVDLFGIHMASAFQTVSLLDLEHAVRTARIAPETARALTDLLESTRWRAEDWQRVFAFEYERLRGQVDAASGWASDGIALGWPWFAVPTGYRWHPHRTLAAIADVFRDQRRKSERFCADAGLRVVAPRLWRPPGPAAVLAPNGLGRLVSDAIGAQSFDPIQLQRCQLETHVSLVEALIAAKAYSDARGVLPDRLEDLVPRYLERLPLDRYDGAPLRYARGVPAVYSVGEDFADAGAGAPPSLDPHEPGLSLAF